MTGVAFEQAMQERDQGALFVLNHSGGKDSQRAAVEVARHVPPEQLLVVHASLGRSEWPGALETAQAHAEQLGAPFIVARSTTHPDLVSMARKRYRERPEVPCWPSAANRQCTSDLKRGPIEREIRRYVTPRGLTRIVNVQGIRAEESHRRAKACTYRVNERNARSGRTWHEWLPIHDLTLAQVTDGLADAGVPMHPAYAQGNERLSCVFCIMASRNDLRNGALQNPELYREHVELERETGYTLHMSRKPLNELTGVEL